MPRPRTPAKSSPQTMGASASPTAKESTQYAYDMLISLRKIVALHKETQLVRLLEAAAEEARSLLERELS